MSRPSDAENDAALLDDLRAAGLDDDAVDELRGRLAEARDLSRRESAAAGACLRFVTLDLVRDRLAEDGTELATRALPGTPEAEAHRALHGLVLLAAVEARHRAEKLIRLRFAAAREHAVLAGCAGEEPEVVER